MSLQDALVSRSCYTRCVNVPVMPFLENTLRLSYVCVCAREKSVCVCVCVCVSVFVCLLLCAHAPMLLGQTAHPQYDLKRWNQQ